MIQLLLFLGIGTAVMPTGASDRTPAAIAREAGVDSFQAELLPEDKAAYIRRLREEGHTVIMLGDGVNDSPALSAADAGIAVSTAAAIAREIADITVSAEDLREVLALRELAEALMRRIRQNYRLVIGIVPMTLYRVIIPPRRWERLLQALFQYRILQRPPGSPGLHHTGQSL